MEIRSRGSWLGGFSSVNMRLHSGNIFRGKALVDASEWDLRVKGSMAAGPVFTRAVMVEWWRR
jgi:hypothetical protein